MVRRVARWWVVAFAFFGVALAASTTQAANEDLRKQIESLRSGISVLSRDAAGDPELQRSLRDLAAALRDRLVIVPNGGPNDDLRRQIEAIKNSIAPFPRNTNDPNLRQALRDLTAAINDASCDNVSDPIDCLVKRVKDAVVDLDAAVQSTNADKKLTPSQKDTLGKTLATLKALVPAPPPKEKEPAIVINIIKAYYGDLRTASRFVDDEYESKFSASSYLSIGDTDRICSATLSMQTYCQGKPACWTTGDTIPTRSGVQLCGYEPAPYASPINKGLAVQYQCVGEDKLDLAAAPSRMPGEVRVIRFRPGEAAQIICSEPPEPPADKSGATK